MRDLLEKHRSAQVVVVIAAACCVLGLVQAAAAHNDLDMREVFRPSTPRTAPQPAPAAHDAGTGSQAAGRPLRITLGSLPKDRRRTGDRQRTAARPKPLHELRLAVLPPGRDELFEPPPLKPAIVSIYEDRTLRHGDAVMMLDGIRVFVGRGNGPHRPLDFMLLRRAASVDMHLRRTLSGFENNPPDRWRS